MMQLTNATKAAIISTLNAALGLAIAIGGTLTDLQTAAILGFGNALLALVVLATYKQSAKRIPDA